MGLSMNLEALMNAMNDELPRIQEQVYFGNINSHTDVLDKFLSDSGIQRYNPKIIADGKVRPKFVSLSASVLGKESVLYDISYLHSPETMDDLKPVTHLLAIGITSKKGMKLLREGIHYLIDGSKNARIGVFFSAEEDTNLPSLYFVKVFEITASSYSHKKGVLQFLDQLCSFYEREYMQASGVTASTQALIDKVFELADINGLPSKGYESAFSGFSADKLRIHLNKVIILAREFGLKLELSDIRVQSLVPEPLKASASAEEFMQQLPKFDQDLTKQRQEAEAAQVANRWIKRNFKEE